MDEEVREDVGPGRYRRTRYYNYNRTGSDSIGFVLFVAWLGALVYFLQHAVGAWAIIMAILKSIVWPALVLYHVLPLLGIS